MIAALAPAARRGCVALADGRTLAWHEWGARTGRPVLFCTGAGMSGALGFGHAVLDPLGVRLLAVDRPGLGASSPHVDKTLTTWVDDIRALLAVAAIERPLVVGFSQGAPFALALAAADVATAVALVSAQDDLGHPALIAQLPVPVAQMVHRARTDVAALEREVAGGASAAWLHDLVLTTSSADDRARYAAEPFASAYAHCLADGFRQGAAGYARDVVLALGAWPFRVEDIHVPVDVWYGALDTSSVHSPDHGATLTSRLPHATRVVLADAGSALLWTHAAPVLARVLERLPAPDR